jgi:hypothetical protein
MHMLTYVLVLKIKDQIIVFWLNNICIYLNVSFMLTKVCPYGTLILWPLVNHCLFNGAFSSIYTLVRRYFNCCLSYFGVMVLCKSGIPNFYMGLMFQRDILRPSSGPTLRMELLVLFFGVVYMTDERTLWKPVRNSQVPRKVGPNWKILAYQ